MNLIRAGQLYSALIQLSADSWRYSRNHGYSVSRQRRNGSRGLHLWRRQNYAKYEISMSYGNIQPNNEKARRIATRITWWAPITETACNTQWSAAPLMTVVHVIHLSKLDNGANTALVFIVTSRSYLNGVTIMTIFANIILPILHLK